MSTMSDCPSTLDVIVKQESTFYRCEDYIGKHNESNRAQGNQNVEPTSEGTNREAWREKICKWTYEVVDHFDYSRETASISLSFLDRFLCKRQTNHRTFQLASMTTLYMAIKLNEARPLRIACMTELSRGLFEEVHIQAMERLILRELDWRVNPPTSQSVARILLEDFASHLPQQNMFHQEIAEVSNFFVELAVCDYFFTTRRPTVIAAASILNAIKIVAPNTRGKDGVLFSDTFSEFVKELLPHMSEKKSELGPCQDRLCSMYHEALDQPMPEATPVASSEASSPVTVATTVDSSRTWYKTEKRRRT